MHQPISLKNSRKAEPRRQRGTDDIGIYLQPLLVTMLLYPLKRIQTNLQIKATYNKQQIKQCKNFITRCTHYGIRSLFRGLTAYFVKVSFPYAFYHLTENVGNQINVENSKTSKQALISITKYSVLGLAYTIIYPFENARVRMGADIERSRVNKNVRDCMSKMRKVEGKSSFYKGFALSLPFTLLQYSAAINIYKYLLSAQQTDAFPQFLKSSTGVSLFFLSYLSSEILLYPIDSIRKIVQINGSLNHENISTRYRDVFTFHKFTNLYRGFGIKISTGLLYTLILLGVEKSPKLY